ncbi:MAG: hypothetical protein AUJ96_06575 [Armatimonadetes bacterium CG2_30_66_41]|nr:hypothetical protein [Armatimonadota bacterium]OIP07944.1 MAG: hypothetical protein AUJ96_06575 [Armatimonadetes bacterium CG2_30_66_41]
MRSPLPAHHDLTDLRALRQDILSSPVAVALHRAKTFTRVWQAKESAPWIVKKALAFRKYLQTVPLYVREHDRLAGAISETPGAMPVYVELGIGENGIYTGEYPHRRGYLRGQVPPDIAAYWEDRNMWGQYRAWVAAGSGRNAERGEVADYKFLSNQGHLSPSYRELLQVGVGGIAERIRQRRAGEVDPQGLEFLTAAEHGVLGMSEWIARYAEFLREASARCGDATRSRELGVMAETAAKVSREAPSTFREALQLVWFVHQGVHLEGHGYSNTPDRLDQLLYPFYRADKEAGRLTDDEALTLCEHFLLKQRDNTFWGVEHNLTQGLVVGGSTPDGADQTNELSWLFLAATGNVSIPEPLVWVRYHPKIDRDFFDQCLQNLAGSTCFPLMMSDTAVPFMFMELGVAREDAFDYVPAGCNELAIPGKAYFNPCAHVDYLQALESAITGGKGYRVAQVANLCVEELPRSFEELIEAVGDRMRRQLEHSYAHGMAVLHAQMTWGQTPFTSCFFDGCLDRARDMVEGTKYNILSCGGIAFANMVDSLATIREVVFRKGAAGLTDVAAACAADFAGHEQLHQVLLVAPKLGNDDPHADDLIPLVERLRDEPLKALCRDPRDGTPFGNCHVVRSGAVRGGANTPATPDGRRAGAPLASSVAASAGCERSGPTALLNSVTKLNPVKSWQSGYNVNLRLHPTMLTESQNRAKVAALLDSYFQRGGQELQINCVSTADLRAAHGDPDRHRDLVVRVAGFSEFFVNLTEDIQEDVIARAEHGV